jgi:hypothetical protein
MAVDEKLDPTMFVISLIIAVLCDVRWITSGSATPLWYKIVGTVAAAVAAVLLYGIDRRMGVATLVVALAACVAAFTDTVDAPEAVTVEAPVVGALLTLVLVQNGMRKPLKNSQ